MSVINFDGRPWAAHSQDHWLDFAGNPNFPDYLRVTFAAYGRHRANGHARLDRKELAAFLVRKNGTLPDRRTVWAAVRRAVQLGYLLDQSNSLCLVVASEHVQGGVGDPDEPCRRDHTKRESGPSNPARDHLGRVRSVGAEHRHSSRSVGDGAGHSETSVGAEHRHSTPEPSLSSPPGRQARPTSARRSA